MPFIDRFKENYIPNSEPNEGFKPVAIKNVQPPSEEQLALNNAIDKLTENAKSSIPTLIRNLNKNSILDFGSEVSVKLTSFTENYLNTVTLLDMNGFKKPLTEISALCANVNATSISSGNLGNTSFFSKLRTLFYSTKEKALSQFRTISDQIDVILTEIDKRIEIMKKTINELQIQYDLNIEEIYMLRAHIIAAEQAKINEQEELNKFIKLHSNDTDIAILQEQADMSSFIDELDRKIYDLKTLEATCWNYVPQIRLEQNNAKKSISSLMNIKTLQIPAWKKMCITYISGLKIAETTAIINKVKQSTNDMYREQSKMAANNSVEAARSLETPIITIETLEETTKNLLQSIDSVNKIEEEGRVKRQQDSTRIEQIKGQVANSFKPTSIKNIN